MRGTTVDYQQRLDALKFTMSHDDGQRANEFETAQVVLVGVSGTMKTPVSIWLANKGVNVANYPLVLCEIPHDLLSVDSPLVLGLCSDAESIVRSRQGSFYTVERFKKISSAMWQGVEAEIAYTRSLCQELRWPTLDITRLSIEEAGRAVLRLLVKRQKTN